MIYSMIMSLMMVMSLSNKKDNIIHNESCRNDERASITFILGSDENLDEQYYSLAKQFHLTDPKAETDYFVDHCRSLESMRKVLDDLAKESGQSWGKINVVVHGNQWTGLSVPIKIDGERVSVDGLLNAIYDGSLAPLEDQIIDSLTNIEIKACGLGSNKDLLETLSYVFGGFDAARPNVHASDYFMQYRTGQNGQIISRDLEPFFAFYRTAFKPADLKIERQFKQRYPAAKIDWLKALNNIDQQVDDLFTTRFNVPIEWEVIFEKSDDELSFKTESEKIDFVRSQNDLLELLTKFEIPIELFRWNMKAKTKDGITTVSVKGKATVVCVLKEV